MARIVAAQNKVPDFLAKEQLGLSAFAGIIPGLPSTKGTTIVTFVYGVLTPYCLILMRVVADDQAKWRSIFPTENLDLVNGNWENEVIWDSQNMKR